MPHISLVGGVLERRRLIGCNSVVEVSKLLEQKHTLHKYYNQASILGQCIVYCRY